LISVVVVVVREISLLSKVIPFAWRAIPRDLQVKVGNTLAAAEIAEIVPRSDAADL